MKKLLLSLTLVMNYSLIISIEKETVIHTISSANQEDLNNAINNEDIEQIEKILISKIANVNEQYDKGYTFLHFLTNGEKNDYIIAEKLINAGANVNIQDCWGNTPLHELIFCERSFIDEDEPELEKIYIKFIELYIQSNANLTLRNNADETPLLTALIHKSYRAAKVLLTCSENIDINAKDDGEITALQIAAMDNALEIAELLIKAGANINNCDNPDHATALHFATEQGAFEVAQLLIRSGANTTLKDRFGFTAYNHCKTTEMRSLFKK